ncbi:hypothetical protein IW261DRAFT_1143516 [Armillaria novae-zelandiae]|uniref:Uncharacterized protein n=1 Tax=Armillaria novae-zelandiae TaxID=153914 RepID=A0AA39PBW6_9AGAR|nr:hypothetical protein IW261DRAFT_1143516 [Armillaria novae-zelandiae]
MYISRPITFLYTSRRSVVTKKDSKEYPGGDKLYEPRDLQGRLINSFFKPNEEPTPPDWEPPLADEPEKYKLFPFTPTLTIRIWNPDCGAVQIIALDFVDAEGNPQHSQRLRDSDVKAIVGKRDGFRPDIEGNSVYPRTVGEDSRSETYTVFGGLPYDFYHEGQLIKSYTFPVDSFTNKLV